MACKRHPTWTADDDCVWCEIERLTRERDELREEMRHAAALLDEGDSPSDIADNLRLAALRGEEGE